MIGFNATDRDIAIFKFQQCQVHAGEEGHARPGWTSRRGQDSVEESIRMTEDRDKWRKYVHGVADRRIEDG